MKTRASMKNRQGGAVAVMVGISIVMLVGFLALVLDLGHLYIAKTELQNAADAAALSGVKQLDNTFLGCCDTTNPKSAVNMAIATAAQNNYDFSKSVDIGSSSPAIISVGSSQFGPWVTVSSVATDADAAGKTFFKVDTGMRKLDTWFAPIFNLITGGNYSTTSTFGMAVAGSIVQNVAPLAVCALKKDSPEYGFRRGVSYNIVEVNKQYVGVGGFSSVPLFLNPVDIPPATCHPNNGSNSFMSPFVCQGLSAIRNVGLDSDGHSYDVYVNTGTTSAQNKSFNSRFDDFNGSACEVATAPPDLNVKEYPCVNNNGTDGCMKTSDAEVKVKGKTQPIPGFPRDWMNQDPVQQSMSPIVKGQVVPTQNDIAHYGVLWSYAREVKTFTSSPPYTPVDYYGLNNWSTLYPGGSADATKYPTLLQQQPYQAGIAYKNGGAGGNADYYAAPPNNPSMGKVDRRVLNMVIVDCPSAKNDSCEVSGMPGYQVPTIAIGSFFMTRPAGLPDRLDVEFAGVVPAGALQRQYVLFR